MLTRVVDFFRGGSRDFDEAGEPLVSFLMDASPVEDNQVLARQLASVRLAQRQHPGRLVVACYGNQPGVPQPPYPGIEYCLAKVSCRSKGQTEAASPVLHKGRFMSFECKVPPGIADIESAGKVVLHPQTYRGVTQEIDAEEHTGGKSETA